MNEYFVRKIYETAECFYNYNRRNVIFVLPFLHEILNGTEFGLNGIFMGNNTASASFLSIVGI